MPVIAAVDVRLSVAYYERVLRFSRHFIFGDPRHCSRRAGSFTVSGPSDSLTGAVMSKPSRANRDPWLIMRSLP